MDRLTVRMKGWLESGERYPLREEPALPFSRKVVRGGNMDGLLASIGKQLSMVRNLWNT